MTRIDRSLPMAASLLWATMAIASSDHKHDHPQEPASGFWSQGDLVQHLDSVHHASTSDDEINEAYLHGHLEMGYRFTPQWQVNGELKLEGHPKGESGHAHAVAEDELGDRWWDEHELMARSLNLEYHGERFGLMAGKFRPVFGLEGHDATGLYGYQLLESYEIAGRMGLAGWLAINEDHRLDLSAFHLDTSPLSQTWITRHGAAKRSDGGVSNTGDLSSWTLAFSGHDLLHEGLSYGIGAARQAKGIDNDHDEERRWLALQQEFSLGEWSGRALIELMDIQHLGGEAAHDRRYNTLGVQFDKGLWTFGGSYSAIDNHASEDEENRDGHVIQASIGYRVRQGVTLEIGFKDAEQDGAERDRIGLALRIETDHHGH